MDLRVICGITGSVIITTGIAIGISTLVQPGLTNGHVVMISFGMNGAVMGAGLILFALLHNDLRRLEFLLQVGQSGDGDNRVRRIQ